MSSPLQAKKLTKLQAISGFTLIELLVVIAIIGLLSSIVLASLGTARNKAADAAIQADLVGVRSSAELYFSNNGDSYGAGFFDGTCLSAMDGVFYQTGIRNAIQHALQQSGFSNDGYGTWCFSNSTSYAVKVALKTQNDSDPFTFDYFCVDGKGQAKMENDVLDGAGGLLGDPQFEPVSCL